MTLRARNVTENLFRRRIGPRFESASLHEDLHHGKFLARDRLRARALLPLRRNAADLRLSLPPAAEADRGELTTLRNLYEIWLAGDHYKWRALRANGIAEKLHALATQATRRKYNAWVRTSPLHPAQSALSLEPSGDVALLRHRRPDQRGQRGVHLKRANAKLAEPDLSVHGILDTQRVAVVCTTDDPADSLEYHQQIRKQGLKTRVYPTFRPDAALKVGEPTVFNSWCDRLAVAANTDVSTFAHFLAALKQRHDFFHEQGCRLSDHGLESCFAVDCNEKQAAGIFLKVRAGNAASPEEVQQFGLPTNALLRPSRRRSGLDEAASPRSAAEQQQPDAGG